MENLSSVLFTVLTEMHQFENIEFSSIFHYISMGNFNFILDPHFHLYFQLNNKMIRPEFRCLL